MGYEAGSIPILSSSAANQTAKCVTTDISSYYQTTYTSSALVCMLFANVLVTSTA